VGNAWLQSVEATCWSTRYRGGFKPGLFEIPTSIKVANGVEVPEIVHDGDPTTVLCGQEAGNLGTVDISLTIQPKDAADAISHVTLLTFSNSSSANAVGASLYAMPESECNTQTTATTTADRN